jgi:hypothetical protein
VTGRSIWVGSRCRSVTGRSLLVPRTGTGEAGARSTETGEAGSRCTSVGHARAVPDLR